MKYKERHNKQISEAFFNELFKIGQGLTVTTNPYEVMKAYIELQGNLETLFNAVYLEGLRDGIAEGEKLQMMIKKN